MHVERARRAGNLPPKKAKNSLCLKCEKNERRKHSSYCRQCSNEDMRRINSSVERKQLISERNKASYDPEKRRWSWMRTLYNITQEQFDELLEKQGGGCALCGRKEGTDKRKLHIDHDHSCCPRVGSCGKCIRGILCSRCNTGLGSFGDNSELLRKAANYLDELRKMG